MEKIVYQLLRHRIWIINNACYMSYGIIKDFFPNKIIPLFK